MSKSLIPTAIVTTFLSMMLFTLQKVQADLVIPDKPVIVDTESGLAAFLTNPIVLIGLCLCLVLVFVVSIVVIVKIAKKK